MMVFGFKATLFAMIGSFVTNRVTHRLLHQLCILQVAALWLVGFQNSACLQQLIQSRKAW
jgi:hypothetical protein